MTLWKDKVTLQKVGVTSWKDRNATNMDKTIKGKCPQGVCSGEGDYITHYTCSNGNELEMNPATTCDFGRNLTACEGYESTRLAGANNVILLLKSLCFRKKTLRGIRVASLMYRRRNSRIIWGWHTQWFKRYPNTSSKRFTKTPRSNGNVGW